MTRCLPLRSKTGQKKKEKEVKREKRVVILEKEKSIKWAINNKKNWEKKEEIEKNHRKIKELVLRRF